MSPKFGSNKGFLSTITTSIGVGGGSSATSAISALSATNSTLSADSTASSTTNRRQLNYQQHDRKAALKEKRRRQKDAERVEKLRLLVTYLKSGSSQQYPLELEADEIELAHDRWCWPPDSPNSTTGDQSFNHHHDDDDDHHQDHNHHSMMSPSQNFNNNNNNKNNSTKNIINNLSSCVMSDSESQTDYCHCVQQQQHQDNQLGDNDSGVCNQQQVHCGSNGKLFYICDDDDLIISSGDTAASTSLAMTRKHSDGGGSCDIHSCQLSSIGTTASCCYQDMITVTHDVSDVDADADNNMSSNLISDSIKNSNIIINNNNRSSTNNSNLIESSTPATTGFIMDQDQQHHIHNQHRHHHHNNQNHDHNHLFICHTNHHHNNDGLLTSISANNIGAASRSANSLHHTDIRHQHHHHHQHISGCGGSTTSQSSNASTTGSGSGCAGSNVSCVSDTLNDYNNNNNNNDRLNAIIAHNNNNMCINNMVKNNKNCKSEQTLRSSNSTTAWSHPQNLAAWIDEEVNSLVNDLEVKSQLLYKEKQSKGAIFALANKCKYKWLCRKPSTSSRST